MPPRARRPHLLPLLVGALALLAAAFVWLGVRLLEHERALAGQRVQQRLESAADAAVALLLRETAGLAAQLTGITAAAAPVSAAADVAERLGPGTRLLIVDAGEAHVFPADGLPYHPAPRRAEVVDARLAVAETLEFAERNPAAAIRILQPLAVARDVQVRAGALLRLGRNLQKLSRRPEALAAFERLSSLGETPVGGLPAALVARYARCELLERLEDREGLEREARILRDDLQAGRWRIQRPTYLFYSRAAQRWLGPLDGPDAGEGHAEAVEVLWREWQQFEQGAGQPAGGRALGAGPLLVMWRAAPERLAGLVMEPGFVEQRWLSAIGAAGRPHAFHVSLRQDPADPAWAVGDGRRVAARTASHTGLPWGLQVTAADPAADAAELAPRRGLIFGGLALVIGVLLASGYTIGRAVSREVAAARLQSDFVAAVSHEFRSPLTSMRQIAELLAGGRVASAERRATYYALLTRESERLHRLVEGLLDFGRAEAGAREYRRDPLDLGRLVRATVDEFGPDARERGHDIELSDPGVALPIRGDGEALSRALWNLLDNAVKYSPGGRRVWVTLSVNRREAVIEVRDEGVGLAPGEANAIFEKFVRGAAAQMTGAKGTGLGLALVRHIVEGHAGTIRAASGTGPGTTFTIALPLEA